MTRYVVSPSVRYGFSVNDTMKTDKLGRPLLVRRGFATEQDAADEARLLNHEWEALKRRFRK